jgi:hypothetical protein
VFITCIDIKREIKLNIDGSGTDKIAVTIYPYSFIPKDSIISDTSNVYSKSINLFFNDTSYLQAGREKIQEMNEKYKIEVISINETGRTDTSKTIEMYYKFNDVTALNAASFTQDLYKGYLQDTIPDNKVEFKTNPDNYELIFRAGKDLSVYNESKDSNIILVKFILDKMFSKGRFSLTIETETYIIYSNADEWKDKTAKWNIPLKDFVTKVNEMIVRFEK